MTTYKVYFYFMSNELAKFSTLQKCKEFIDIEIKEQTRGGGYCKENYKIIKVTEEEIDIKELYV